MTVRGAEAADEGGRRLAHALFGLPAFAAVVMDWRATLFVALFFLFLNVELLPRTRLGSGWRRPGEGALGGLVAYPLSVCLLTVIFRENTVAIGAGWAAMSFGDPAASYFGKRLGGAPCPWNPRKRLRGAAAFALVSAPALVCVHAVAAGFTGPAVAAGLAVAVAGALIETLPLPLDDNLVVALGAGACAAAVGAF